jgi:hypothetical protein
MKLQLSVGAAVAAAILSCAGPADASRWVAFYTGHLDDGYDASGVFGAPGRDLTGSAFIAAFFYDPDHGSRTTTATSDKLSGDFHDSGLAFAQLTIHGVSFNYDFRDTYALESDNPSPFGAPGPGYVFHNVTQSGSFGALGHLNNQLILAGATAAPARLDHAVAEHPVVDPFSGGPADYLGYFRIDQNLALTGAGDAFGDLRPETYSVRAIALPEPATWGLMLLGFGGVGSVLRSRRRAAAA